MVRTVERAVAALVIVAAANAHCGTGNNSSANAANGANGAGAAGASASSGASSSASSANGASSASSASSQSSAAPATPPASQWITREDAERRLRANAMIVEHLRSERATYGDEPEISVIGTPTQNCQRNTAQCQWVFATDMRTSSSHAEPLHFAVDPYSGVVTRCTDDSCNERSER